MKRIAVAVAAALILAVAGFGFLIANPLNLGVKKSRSFTVRKFESIRPGDRIQDVTTRLGPPLTVTKDVGFPGLCDTGDCEMHAYTGSQSSWVIGHKEAWVLVDRRGVVLHSYWNEEP